MKSNKLINKGLTREEFLKGTAKNCLLALGITAAFSPVNAAASILEKKLKENENQFEAGYYKKLDQEDVQCLLCPHRCIVSKGERGECGVRENREGKYYSLVYNRPCAIHLDPVEKKPLFHVYPGEKVFSLATAGCNLGCLFCQNWQISQARPEEVQYIELSPEDIIKKVKELNSKLIAYTYSEPTIFFEYMLDIAKKAKKEGIVNTCHSNGYINPEPLKELLELIEAANIDLKGFTQQYYKEMCKGELKPVLNSLKQIKKSGTHLELTTLIVPTKNDKPETIRQMCKWIKNELGEDVPLHFSRFYPRYKLQNLPPTPVETIEMARQIALEEDIRYIYIGNLRPGHEAENTFCPNCKKVIIERNGYLVKRIELKKGKCGFCNHKIAGLWGE